MESQAVGLLNQKGDLKQKNVVTDGRNRKVLQDIGNRVTRHVADGKPIAQRPHRPVNKKQLAEVVNRAAARCGGDTKKKMTEKWRPKPEEVIVISSDEEENSKNDDATRRSYRTVKKTFSSSLEARSKAACGLTKRTKEPIVDIDADNVNNELEVVEYVDELYKFYKLAQDEGRVLDYMDLQPDINAKMRAILIDWLVDVHRKFELMPETLYLTVNIIDRYLSTMDVPKRSLQLVGISSMLIASKYEEIWAPEVNDFVCISDKAYAREQVLTMEKSILDVLEWYLTVPTSYVFLVRYIKASIPSDRKMASMAFYLAELGLVHYSTIVLYCPSMIAASAVYTARCTLKMRPLWTATLKHYTGYSEDQLMDCSKLLVSLHSAAPQSKLRALYNKFARTDYESVALLPPAW